MTSFDATLRLAQLGDLDAIHALYEQYAPAVHGYLRGHGIAEADDVTSEVFVGILRTVDAFSGDEPAFRRWLFVITHRRLLDERRRLGRQRSEAMEPAQIDALAVNTAPDAGDLAVQALENDRVLEMLRPLTDTQRSVVLLHTIGGLRLRTVAEMLGKEVGAVKSLHRRALAKIVRSSALEDPRVSER